MSARLLADNGNDMGFKSEWAAKEFIRVAKLVNVNPIEEDGIWYVESIEKINPNWPTNFSVPQSEAVIWDALHTAKESGLIDDDKWDNICLAMAWIKEGK